MFKKAPPPEAIVWQDYLRIFVSLATMISGAIVLYRAMSLPQVPPLAIVVGVAMVAFGAYRLRLAWKRYQTYVTRQRGERR
ncbi:MAG: hypothetical protein HYX92_19405 [Chloroflexi bacterium]|nr:hypothetical protein [Chloroflexota bacterium]